MLYKIPGGSSNNRRRKKNSHHAVCYSNEIENGNKIMSFTTDYITLSFNVLL